jgi:hypothetical protein
MTAILTGEPQRLTGVEQARLERLRALQRANEIRLARAELKRRIADGEVSAAEVILNPPREALSWSLGDLLITQRRWGAQRCRKFLLRNNVSETKRLGSLTDRQRRLLAANLGTASAEPNGARRDRPLELVGVAA